MKARQLAAAGYPQLAILMKLESSNVSALLGLDEGPVRLVLVVSPVHLVSPVQPTLPARYSAQREQESEMTLSSYLTAVLGWDREPEIFRCQ